MFSIGAPTESQCNRGKLSHKRESGPLLLLRTVPLPLPRAQTPVPAPHPCATKPAHAAGKNPEKAAFSNFLTRNHLAAPKALMAVRKSAPCETNAGAGPPVKGPGVPSLPPQAAPLKASPPVHLGGNPLVQPLPQGAPPLEVLLQEAQRQAAILVQGVRVRARATTPPAKPRSGPRARPPQRPQASSGPDRL